MIMLKLLLEGKYDYGCIMAMIDQDTSKEILDFNYSTIKENDLYINGDQFGRETHPHITVKYGLTKSYSEKKMKDILKSIKPFKLKIKGISLFENEDFDVIKLDVESEDLMKLNEKISKLPNEDKYPEYHPHLTLAYVKKGKGKKYINEKPKFGEVIISNLEYSDKGEKIFFNL